MPTAIVGLLSIAVLVFGADKVVEKMQAVAHRYDVSDVVIAMTIISFGTSLPEITSHLMASYGILTHTLDYQVASAAVLGGNIGSNVVQQTLIMGLVIIIAGSLKLSPRVVRRDYLPMIGAHVLTLLLVVDGTVSRFDGLALLTMFVGYMLYLYTTRHEKLLSTGDVKPSSRPLRDLSIAVIAMLAIGYSARIFLEVVQQIVAYTGLGGSMVAVVTLGVAAALPELITAVEAIRQGSGGISVGTLVGSNITNPLLGIGLGATVSTYAVPRGLYLWDLPVEIVTGAVILGYIHVNDRIPLISDRLPERHVIGKAGGVMLVLLYLFYVYIRFQYFAIDFV